MKHLLISVAMIAACGAPAWAQDTEFEVIVSANKRGDSTAQDLPLAMNVFSAEELNARNVEDLQSLSYAMPNVQLEDIGTARGIANFSIRGVGVNSSIASVDPAVGVFVDGVYQGVNAGGVTDMLDVEAVEVLRGPQGTLYGRNVTGGAVLMRTREPGDAFEAYVRAGLETGTNWRTQAVVSGPIAEGLISGRLALLYANDDGWLENAFDGSSFGANETSIARATLRLTPAPDLEFILRLEQGDIEGDGPAGQNHALHSRDGFNFSIDNRGYAATDWEQATLEANWNVAFGNGVITSITGWRSVEVPWAADIDSTPNFVFHTRVLNVQSQRSEELRYAGTFGDFVVGVGAYWLDQDLLYIDERNFSPAFRRTGGGRGWFTTMAAFANVDWHATEQITLSAGLRYTDEEKESRISRVRRAIDDLDGAVVVPGEGVDGGSIDTRSLNYSDAPFLQQWDDFSPRLGIQWEPNSDTNLYATWSRALRGGGANFRTASLGLAPRAYDAEEQETFEIGWKQRFGRAGFVNAALFHNSIERMQRETNQPDPISGVQQIVLNAGDATIWGGEIEASFALGEHWVVGAHAGYTHGEYDRITEDLNGDLVINATEYALEIPRLAPWSYGVSAQYSRNVGAGEVAALVSYNHRDAAFYNDSNLGRLAEVDMIDLNFTWAPAARWEVSLYGENLLNEATWGGDTVLPATAAFGYSGGERPTFSPLNKGRVFGVELRVRFGE